MAAPKRRKTLGTCKSKSRYGHNLVKRRKRGKDGVLRTTCVMTVPDKKRARADAKKSWAKINK